MHRKPCMPRYWLGIVLLGGLLLGGAGAGSAAAQEGPVPSLLVPINGTKKIQMSSKQLIKTVQNQDPNVVRVSALNDDPTAVLLTGLMAGTSRVTLTDKENRSESFDVVVQLDIEFLRKVLRDAVPAANITPIPVSGNNIILEGTVAKVEDVQIVMDVARSVVGGIQLTNALRIGGVQQVQLCVTVAEVSRSEMRRMQFEFLRTGPNNVFASTLGTPLSFTSTLGPISPISAMASAIGVPGNLFYGILNPRHGFFGWLEALRDDNLTKILANPSVTTISGRPASFLSGGEQAIPVPAGLGQIGVQFEEFGTRLNVLPIVLGNGKIHLEVEPEVSDLNAAFGTSISGTIVPGRTTHRAHVTVEMESGQTFAIGGLIQHKVTAITQKVPIVGDLPFLGVFFSAKQYTETEDELLILVTPHLVDALACNQLPKYLPGLETRSPDDFELFLEGILEAPRGPRETCPDGHYQAAWKNGPSSNVYPCGDYGFGRHGVCDCANGHGDANGDKNGAHPPVAPPGLGAPVAATQTPGVPAAQAQGAPAAMPPGVRGEALPDARLAPPAAAGQAPPAVTPAPAAPSGQQPAGSGNGGLPPTGAEMPPPVVESPPTTPGPPPGSERR